MKKCPSCIKYVNDDAAILCQYCGTTLLDTQISPNALADTIGTDDNNETPAQTDTQSTPPPKSHVVEQQSDNPRLRLALIRLQSLSEYLPEDDMGENYVND